MKLIKAAGFISAVCLLATTASALGFAFWLVRQTLAARSDPRQAARALARP